MMVLLTALLLNLPLSSAQNPQESYRKLVESWPKADSARRADILKDVGKIHTAHPSFENFVGTSLPGDLPRLKLVFRRHFLAATKQNETYFRVVGFFSGPGALESFTLKTSDRVLIDKRSGVGKVQSIPSGDGFSAVPAPGVIPARGLYRLELKTDKGLEFAADFFVLETMPTELPKVDEPTANGQVSAGFPTFNWQPFAPKDSQLYFKRETFISLALQNAAFKDTLWERLFSQPTDPEKQITKIDVEAKDSKLMATGLQAGQKFKFLMTQLEQNYLAPGFFISRESTIEFPVTVKGD